MLSLSKDLYRKSKINYCHGKDAPAALSMAFR